MPVYRTYSPQPPLAEFVDLIWLYEGFEQTHTREYRLPDGSMELIINLHDDTIPVYDRQNTDQFQTFRGCVICGAHSESFIIDTASLASVMGVHFKPGGAFPFFKLPASELHNAHVSLQTVWGAAVDDLREQLLEAETLEIRSCILEQALLARLARPLVGHPAVAFALKEFQEAVRTSPDNYDAHYRLARIYRQLGRMEEAAKEFAIVQRLHEERKAEPLMKVTGPQ